jgi:thioredoxin-like negative regulator of GroEL
MSEIEPNGAAWLVACLCAAWCRTCDDYRATFDAMSLHFAGRADFVWVDIEDDEDALGNLDVVDFPTLLIAQGETIHFLGPVLPHAQAARQLLDRALRHELAVVRDASLAGLPARVAALRTDNRQ